MDAAEARARRHYQACVDASRAGETRRFAGSYLHITYAPLWPEWDELSPEQRRALIAGMAAYVEPVPRRGEEGA